MNRLKNTIEKMGKMAPVTPAIRSAPATRDSYRSFHRTGPELLVTRILMVNGPLTSKEIWRIYERSQGIEGQERYWPSLTKLKDTLKFMRTNEKIASNGYSYRDHIFRGWKVQEQRALKYVHPEVIEDIQKEIAKRDNL